MNIPGGLTELRRNAAEREAGLSKLSESLILGLV